MLQGWSPSKVVGCVFSEYVTQKCIMLHRNKSVNIQQDCKRNIRTLSKHGHPGVLQQLAGSRVVFLKNAWRYYVATLFVCHQHPLIKSYCVFNISIKIENSCYFYYLKYYLITVILLNVMIPLSNRGRHSHGKIAMNKCYVYWLVQSSDTFVTPKRLVAIAVFRRTHIINY